MVKTELSTELFASMFRNYLVTLFLFSYIKGIICNFQLHYISKEKSHKDPSPCPNI